MFSIPFPSSQIFNTISYHLSSRLLPLSTQQQQGLTTHCEIKSEGWIATMALRRISHPKSATPSCNEHTPSSVPLLVMNTSPSYALPSLPTIKPSYEICSGAIVLVSINLLGGKVMEHSSASSSNVALTSLLRELNGMSFRKI